MSQDEPREKKTRARRPNARAAEVIAGAIEENAIMLGGSSGTVNSGMLNHEFVKSRASRIVELVEELRRSLSKQESPAAGTEE